MGGGPAHPNLRGLQSACDVQVERQGLRADRLELAEVAARRVGPPALGNTAEPFNRHATFKLNGKVYERTDSNWQKWRPDDPTSPHWYTPQTLRDLIAAYVAEERRRR